MTATPLATFVVERRPGYGYRVTSAQGGGCAPLQGQALEILDLLGQPNPIAPPEVHAWLGPVGPRGEFVRILMERLPTGEMRYHQAWFADAGLPADPALLDPRDGENKGSPPTGWPGDVERVLGLAQRAAETGHAESVSVPPGVDVLHYCAALTQVFEPFGNRITWITHTDSAGVPVHLRLRCESDRACVSVHSPDSLDVAKRRLTHVVPVQSPDGVRRAGASLALVGILMLFALAAGGALGWWARLALEEKKEHVAETSKGDVPFDTSAGTGKGPAPPPPPEDPKLKDLREQIGKSRQVRAEIRDFLNQDGLGLRRAEIDPSQDWIKFADARPSQEKVRVTDTKLKRGQVVQLSNLLEALEKLQPASDEGK